MTRNITGLWMLLWTIWALGIKRTWDTFMSVVVRFCHAHITYRNVDRSSHRTMGISHCEKVYSSISASIPTGTDSTPLSPCQITSSAWNVVVLWMFFFQESLFEWQWFSSEVVISLNMSHTTSRHSFQQIKMCRNRQASQCFHNFICSKADHIQHCLLNMTQFDSLKQSIYVALPV